MVSDHGEVKSMPVKLSNGRVNFMSKERILKPAIDGWGYQRVAMMLNGKLITRKVHRLVAQAFIPNPENKPTVNHKNTIKTDNTVLNLEWATQSENFNHAITHGVINFSKGAKHYKAKITLQYTKDGVLLSEWPTVSSAAKSIGKDPGNIISCLLGKRRIAYGFIWKYK